MYAEWEMPFLTRDSFFEAGIRCGQRCPPVILDSSFDSDIEKAMLVGRNTANRASLAKPLQVSVMDGLGAPRHIRALPNYRAVTQPKTQSWTHKLQRRNLHLLHMSQEPTHVSNKSKLCEVTLTYLCLFLGKTRDSE